MIEGRWEDSFALWLEKQVWALLERITGTKMHIFTHFIFAAGTARIRNDNMCLHYPEQIQKTKRWVRRQWICTDWYPAKSPSIEAGALQKYHYYLFFVLLTWLSLCWQLDKIRCRMKANFGRLHVEYELWSDSKVRSQTHYMEDTWIIPQRHSAKPMLRKPPEWQFICLTVKKC